MSSGIKKLIKYQEQGYVFHGSSISGIDILEPREATDTDETREFNIDTAIFASSSIAASIIFACMGKNTIPPQVRNGTWSVGSSGKKGGIVSKIPSKWRPYILNNRGYVYVLLGDTFINKCTGGWQVKSKTAVKPIDVIEVCFGDFEKLGGVIQWQDDSQR